jgi:hypothetical protein
MSDQIANVSAAGRLAHPFSVEDHELARQTIVAAMTATKTVRARDPDSGKIIYVHEPDWTVRLPAAVKVAEFVGGKPVAMTVTANLTPGQAPASQDDFLRNVLRDKAAIGAVQDILSKMVAAEERTRREIDVSTSEAASLLPDPAGL